MNLVRAVCLLVLLGVVVLVPIGPIAAACIWAACLAVLARSGRDGILSPAPLYLLLLGLFHLGLVVPVALGATRTEAPSWIRSAHLGAALGLFSVAAVSFTLGVTRVRAPALREDASSLPPQRTLFLAGLLVSVAGATMLWTGVRQLGVLSRGYGAYFERAVTEDVRLFGFGVMLFPLGLLVAAAGATRRQMYALGGMLLVVLGPVFLGGFRGPMIVQVMALLAVWMRKDRRVARRLAVGVLAATIAAVPAIRMSRDRDGRAPPGTFDPMAVLLETGWSLRPLVLTAERLEPGTEPLWMGRSYIMAVGRIVPNVSSRRAAADRSLTPSGWATLHADRWAYFNGFGIGFSGVAEPYLNFGKPGVVLVFLLLGLVIRVWERWLASDPFRAAVGAASFGALLWTVRNDAMAFPRVLALASIIVLAAWLVARFGARRGTERWLVPGGI